MQHERKLFGQEWWAAESVLPMPVLRIDLLLSTYQGGFSSLGHRRKDRQLRLRFSSSSQLLGQLSIMSRSVCHVCLDWSLNRSYLCAGSPKGRLESSAHGACANGSLGRVRREGRGMVSTGIEGAVRVACDPEVWSHLSCTWVIVSPGPVRCHGGQSW